MMITKAKLDEIADRLRNLPAVPKAERSHTKREAVQLLKPVIEQLKKKGYNLEQIATFLREESVEISTSSLRSYLQPTKSATARIHEPKPRSSKSMVVTDTQDSKPQSTPGSGSFQVRPDTEDL